MEYLIGSKQEFLDFVNRITSEDKVAILTHLDLDGLASGIFLEEILKSKNIKLELIELLEYKDNMYREIKEVLIEKNITKVFVSDLGVNKYFADFSKGKFEFFFIDHHPISFQPDFKNLILTNSFDCSAVTIYRLGEGLIDYENWNWLVSAAIFSDMSYKNPENLKLMQSIYPDISEDESLMSSTIPGVNARKIASALIYYDNDKKRVYDLVREKKIDELNHAFNIVEEEIDSLVEAFAENSEFYPKKNIYWYEVKPKFSGVSSIVASIISRMKPEGSFVIVAPRDNFYKISARNQGNTDDMNKLMRKGVEGLEGASGGGHIPASAALVRREDLEKFKKNILR